MRSDWLDGFGAGTLVGVVLVALLAHITGCAPTRPCVGTYQADSAWTCAPRDTTRAR